jgi:hypothetical protein
MLVSWVLVHPVESAERRTERLVMSAPDIVVISGGDTATIPVTLQLAPDWHINTNQPIQDYLIPTELTLSDAPPEVLDVQYPAGENYSFAFSKEELRVYSDTTVIDVTVQNRNVSSRAHERHWKLTFQPCSDRQCLRPKTIRLPIDFRPSADAR